MRKGFLIIWGLSLYVSSCGIFKSKKQETESLPLTLVSPSNTSITSADSTEKKMVSTPIMKDSAKALDSKPLNATLVIFRVQPAEMANHVPVRTQLGSFGTTTSQGDIKVLAYPSPTDIHSKSTPIPLNNGFFLDRTGFIGAGTRFLDLHFADFETVNPEYISNKWFQEHIIPEDAMQFEWFTCDCNKGDEVANVKLLNTMISIGLNSFKHPEISTQIDPKFGVQFPK